MAAAEFLIIVLGIMFSTCMHCDGFPMTLTLERVGSADVTHNELIARDRVRHTRTGIVDFPLHGSPDSIVGLYFTRVKIGNPPREYHVMIDTGSEVTWLNCNPCIGCPRTSHLMNLSFFDPSSSSSAAPVSCSDRICKSVVQDFSCSSDSLCSYSIPYGDGSSASGYYVSDMFHFDTVIGKSAAANYSANIVFGCTNNQSGSLTNPKRAVDGLFGFAPHPVSFVSQLASRGLMPNVFSHCLKGADKGGGGILVLGEIVEPGIMYSPLVPSQPYYNLNLLSISINGHTVPIDPKTFATSENRGTIVDSGTTYAYLAEEAYDSFINTFSVALPPSIGSSSYSLDGSQCFLVSNSVVSRLRDVLPVVSLNFEGGASMVLKPKKYLVPRFDDLWCIGIQKNQFKDSQGMTILGDLVLKDTIIVYDWDRQRLGWVDYDCSSSVNVSLGFPGKHVSSSSRDGVLNSLIPIATAGCGVVTVGAKLVVRLIAFKADTTAVADVAAEEANGAVY